MYLDSPMELCPICKEYVLLDQSHAECALEHHCQNHGCPLAKFFTGKKFRAPDENEPGAGDKS